MSLYHDDSADPEVIRYYQLLQQMMSPEEPEHVREYVDYMRWQYWDFDHESEASEAAEGGNEAIEGSSSDVEEISREAFHGQVGGCTSCSEHPINGCPERAESSMSDIGAILAVATRRRELEAALEDAVERRREYEVRLRACELVTGLIGDVLRDEI